MKTSIFENIYNHPNIKKEDYKNIMDAHTKVEFSKNDTILKEGKISNEYFLIKKGLFRSFVIDYKGNEITTDFFSPNDILIEVASLFLRIPSKETIQILENRAAENGAEIIQAKMGIGKHSFVSIVKDTEGNSIGFHSLN